MHGTRALLARRALGAILFAGLILTFSFLYSDTAHADRALRSIEITEIIVLTNVERTDHGLSPVTQNETLTTIAEERASDMASQQYFAHESPTGKQAWDYMREAGYAYSHAGENLAVHFYTPEQLVDAWMHSETHKRNILNPDFEDIGVGIAKGYRKGHEGYYVVQIFGTLLGN